MKNGFTLEQYFALQEAGFGKNVKAKNRNAQAWLVENFQTPGIINGEGDIGDAAVNWVNRKLEGIETPTINTNVTAALDGGSQTELLKLFGLLAVAIVAVGWILKKLKIIK